MNIILDMGGVLMAHNLPGCIAAFIDLMGADQMKSVLGLAANGEGTTDSLMEQFESGDVDEQQFIQTLLPACRPDTTAQQIVDAWTLMHGGIPQYKLDIVRHWHDAGHHILLLSNSNPIHERDIETNYDMSMFDHRIYSHRVHAHKPERAIYEEVQRYLKQQGWDQLPTIFVDDIEANRKVGQLFGWTTYADLSDLNI